MANLEWALICKNVSKNQAGELLITEPFTYIYSDQYPTKPQTFFVVSMWSGLANEKFKMKITLTNTETGEAIISNSDTFYINIKSARIDEMYSEIIFANPGEYRVDFYINETLAHSATLSLFPR